jgi:hypothetical protein
MAVEDVLKNALQDRVRKERNNPTLVLDFKNGKLNQHVGTDEQAQAVVIDASSNAADQFGLVLNSKGRQIIRSSITLGTGYGAAVTVMEEAVSKGADAKEIVG